MKFKVFLVALSLLSAVTVFGKKNNNIRAVSAYGRRYVYLEDVARYYGMKYSKGKKESSLSSRYSHITFTHGRRKGTLNSVSVNYLFAPFVRKGKTVVSEKDFLLVIDPVLRYRALRRHRIGTIVIDAGHGGKDNGTSGKNNKEKKITLNLAKKLRWLLKKNGYKVVMTRSRDKFISLKNRAKHSNRNKGDLFLSIHCNAAGSSANGIETFVLTPAGAPSTRDTKGSPKKYSGNGSDKNNMKLAYEVHKSLLAGTKAKDRGVRHARFAVLKDIKAPGILLEVGYLSNSSEERKLSSNNYQNKLVRSIYNGIARYHRELVRY